MTALNGIKIALLSSVIFLGACAPAQPLNFSVQNVQASAVTVDADLRGITVTPGAPNERTGVLPPEVAAITNIWKEATQEALARAAIFNDGSKRHVNLEIKILKLDSPGAGFTFPTDTTASYTLVDRANGSIVFTQLISAEGETPLNFAFIGAIRARESINRSVQNNIAAFVDAAEHSPLAISRMQPPTS
ncbi:MAG: UDP-N-acetylglucosamine acyltransferase [Rhodospirillales bacterium]|nr:UDP-N-acetylglucosamine acyltransferase [Rhodospirillales bacterium]